jgi:hypothetical protein
LAIVGKSYGRSLAAERRLWGVFFALGRCGSRRFDPIRRCVQLVGVALKSFPVRLLAQARRHVVCALR